MAGESSSMQGPYLGHRMDRKAPKVIGTLPSMLAAGEHVWALFVVNGMVPQTDFLVVTNCRIATGIAHGLRDKGALKGVFVSKRGADRDGGAGRGSLVNT